MNYDNDNQDPDVGEDIQHLDDLAIDRFAEAMKLKMAASRAKGRSGWCSRAETPHNLLVKFLEEHVAKGDPVDVGNFAMMLWNRGERTTRS